MHPHGRLSLPSHLACVLLLLSSIAPTLATKTNRTIDDNESVNQATHKAPVYQPPDKWNFGPTCSQCIVKLDGQSTNGDTWHDTTASVGDVYNITLTFTGTALYIYAIVPNFVQGAATHVNMTFTMDGSPSGPPYYHEPSRSTDISYNVPVYSKANLANQQHTFVLTPTPGTEQSLAMFDYAVYTFDDGKDDTVASSTALSPVSSSASSANRSKSTNVGAIVGGVVGGIAVLLAAFLALFCLCRRRRSTSQHQDTSEKAYMPNTAYSRRPLPFTPQAPFANFNPDQSGPFGGILSIDRAASTAPVILAAGAPVAGPESTSVMRQATLERQLTEMQHQIGALYSGPGGAHASSSPEAAGEAAVLRAQVDALRGEVERLRAENAPPAYFGQPTAARGEAGAIASTGTPSHNLSDSGSIPYGKQVLLAASR